MATKVCTSGYSAWVQMKKENENVMAYKNIGRRVLILQEHGYLEEINLKDVENLHGRKDYRLTIKGLECLIPHILTHPEDIKNINKYIDQSGLDRQTFEISLSKKFRKVLDSTNLYYESVKREFKLFPDRYKYLQIKDSPSKDINLIKGSLEKLSPEKQLSTFLIFLNVLSPQQQQAAFRMMGERNPKLLEDLFITMSERNPESLQKLLSQLPSYKPPVKKSAEILKGKVRSTH